MGVIVDMQNNGGSVAAKGYWGLRSFIRRKHVDSVLLKREGSQQLAKRLSVIDLIAIGVGATIGAGVYILVGTVAREQTGPALTISFLIAGIAAALSAFCYAELACRCPSAGSAYHYTYICIGEGAAWLVGWALILEYTIGGSAIARGLTPNLALFFGGQDKLPLYLARQTIPGVGIVVDPSAAVLVLIVTVLLCLGIKESSFAQAIVTTVNICGMLFIIIVGGYLAFKTNWVGYELPSGYFPLGLNGMLAGSAVVFFSFIGFDVVASTAEEVKNPQRDLPLGIGISLSLCCILYMLVSVIIVGLVPYFALDPDTPISTAFASHGMQWAVYVITTGAVTALCASLMGSLLPQPRMFMAMARDGLLPSFFSDINEHTQVPVKSTIVIGILAAALAFFMDVSQLAGMVSVGTLLAFTAVAVSVLILRYVPPDEVPLPSSLHESIDSVLLQSSGDIQEAASQNLMDSINYWESRQCLLDKGETSMAHPFLQKHMAQDEENQQKRRKIAAWSITIVCIGVIVLTSAASFEILPSLLRFALCTVGGALLLCSLVVLACISQDNARHSFGHTGGFVCPFVPFLPVACILVNTYLLVNLGGGTWIRVLIWLLAGELVYLFYGQTHSSLLNSVYVSTACADEIYRTSSSHLV
ncbi:cationic amino acid transporter 4, vacuolar [Ricinus communis]|uniref:cationic amino acid transporter 4, vacuolar n=1 Tax=Ricinus communis TaxID=3988 RepID=UPI000772C1C5|nr:cationic amino acid transporter 4, vacuolar [Ricinus communis]|eukprot:XP_002525691.2 cationic amino acid transporter 4, vacuolar [Ricinus communis]